VAATGMLAEINRQTVLTNNLTNVQTPGYKADVSRQQEFSRVLMHERTSGTLRGTQSSGPVSDQFTRMEQGTIERTDNPLDLAISGDGFFAVQTEGGVQYTRNGRFTVNGQGQLSDAKGNAVLSTTGAPIQVGDRGESLKVRPDGVVTSARGALGTIQTVGLTGPEKVGEGDYWTGTPGVSQSVVQQGAIEASGTNPTTTMVDMIQSQRSLEAGQKVLRTIDESLGKAATLGSVSGG
jgi:flagellar basal-body rod protein FlgF